MSTVASATEPPNCERARLSAPLCWKKYHGSVEARYGRRHHASGCPAVRGRLGAGEIRTRAKEKHRTQTKKTTRTKTSLSRGAPKWRSSSVAVLASAWYDGGACV